MTKPENSQNEGQSSGSIGPIEMMWNHFLEFHKTAEGGNGPSPEQIELAKFIHYTACMSMYNTFVGILKSPDYKSSLLVVSEAMRKDFDQYFKADVPKTH